MTDTPFADADVTRTAIAEVLADVEGDRQVARDLFGAHARLLLAAGGLRHPAGAIVAVALDDGRVREVLAGPDGARRALWDIAARHGARPLWSPEALRETAALVADPGLDDPSLEDLTALPFVTIDNDDSRDLDQALHVAPADGGWLVHYALADASHAVRAGSALFAEALARGASFYLPGLCVPMLPPALSEGIVSLNPAVLRRAVVFVMRLDGDGRCLSTRILRARVQSRAKLSYDGVQAYYDAPDADPLRGAPWEPVLQALREVGRLRIALADRNDVVQYNRVEVDVGFADPHGRHFVAVGDARNDTERYNEQISLLCNVEGARVMTSLADEVDPATGEGLRSVFRVHPAPTPAQIDALVAMIDAIVAQRDLDRAVWRWRRGDGESLADWLDRLPREGEARAVFLAMQRQALLTNQRSSFAAEPGLHHGVGAPAYARFSSPMREVAGIFTHEEALGALGLARPPGDPAVDEGSRPRQVADRSRSEPAESAGRSEVVRADGGRRPLRPLQAAVIAAANRSRDVQRQLTKEANKLVLDDVLAADLRRDPGARPVHAGSVIGIAGSKLYVQLDEPPLEVKIYLDDVARAYDAEVEPVGRAAVAVVAGDERVEIALGDVVRVVVEGYDERRGRWLLLPARFAALG